MSKVVYLLLALSLGLNAGLLVARWETGPPERSPAPGAGERPLPPPADPEAQLRRHVQGLTRHLDLSASQQRAVHDALRPYMGRMMEERRRLRDLEAGLSAAFAARPFDETRLREQARRATAARAAIDSLAAVMLVAEGAVLTPEQRERFAEVAPVIHVDPQRAAGPPRR